MKCKKCGNEIIEGNKFCGSCGSPVENKNIVEYNAKIIYDGDIKKCPNCGKTLNSFMPYCPECGYELRGVQNLSSVTKLNMKLEELDAKKSEDESFGGALTSMLKKKIRGNDLSNINRKKIELIKNFVIPNTKEDIFEFMILASTNIEPVITENMSTAEREMQNLLADAWKAKFEQAYKKAKLSFGNSDDFKQIEYIYNEHLNKKKKKKKLAIVIVLASISLLLAFAAGIVGIVHNAKEQERQNIAAGKIKIGYSSNEFEDMQYEAVVDILESKGFSNIETVDLNDLVTGWLEADGEVESISIDGDSDFDYNDYFHPTANVIITFHSFPDE